MTDPGDEMIREYWEWFGTLPALIGARPIRSRWWHPICRRAGDLLLAAGDWLIERSR